MTTEEQKKDSASADKKTVAERTTGKIRKIVVDRDACIGARSCVVVAENVFQIDEENLAYIVDGDLNDVDEDLIKLAAESCPVLAIHLYDEDGNKIFPKE